MKEVVHYIVVNFSGHNCLLSLQSVAWTVVVDRERWLQVQCSRCDVQPILHSGGWRLNVYHSQAIPEHQTYRLRCSGHRLV